MPVAAAIEQGVHMQHSIVDHVGQPPREQVDEGPASITEQLCRKILALGPDSLTADVLGRVHELVLDGIAVAIAGAMQEKAPRILAKYFQEESGGGGRNTATVLGFGFKASPSRAAYLNAAAMHVLDYEPMWDPANHALSTTLPAALAVAESTGCDGRTLALALVRGIEMQGWIRQASRQDGPGTFVLHPPGQVGPMSSAVAAATVLGLDEMQLRHALGFAASRCGGVMANVGTMTKCVHCGMAAAAGVEAAELALRGFDSNPDVFDDARGYVRGLHGPSFVTEDLLHYGAPPLRVVSPGYSLKYFPSHFFTHWAITCGLNLHSDVRGQAVERVHLVTPNMPYVDRPKPTSGLMGKFSWQYSFAAALLDGKVTMASFTDQRRFKPDMESLLEKVTVEMRDDIKGVVAEGCYVVAEVVLTDGRQLSTRCDGPPGSWTGPPADEGAHAEKVRECFATMRLSREAAGEVAALTAELEALDAEGLGRLLSLVRGPADPQCCRL